MLKIECYFPEEQEPDDMAVHGIDFFQIPEFTLCRVAWEEWDCGYEYKERITNKPITCKNCISALEHYSKYQKTEEGWI